MKQLDLFKFNECNSNGYPIVKLSFYEIYDIFLHMLLEKKWATEPTAIDLIERIERLYS